MRTIGAISFLMVLGLVVPTVLAQGSASGQLKVAGDVIQPTQALAVEARSSWEKDKKIIQVYLFSAQVESAGLTDRLDVEDALRERIRSVPPGDFIVVTLELSGEFTMAYAFIEDGAKNFGFGSTGKTEGCKASEGKVAGRAWSDGPQSLGDTPYEFDLKFSADVVPERKPGKALADGGAPGQAYLAYVKALQEGDFAVLVQHMDKAEAEQLAATPEEYRVYSLDSMKDMAPKKMSVSKGESFGSWAIVYVSGQDWSEDKVEGRIRMVKDGDTWRVAEEDLETIW